MADEVRLGKADIKKAHAKVPVTMRGLWRLVSWGTTAAVCLLVAVLASRGMVGSQRAAVAVATIKIGTTVASVPIAQQPTFDARAFDAQAETKRLSDAVRELASENDQLKARLGMVEHSMDDVTGSIAQQQASGNTAPAAPPAPWPDDTAPAATTPAAFAAVMAPALPLPMEYGADLGGATSMAALRARWAGIRSAHPHVFDGLAPMVSLGQMAPPSRPELRLVVGPLPSADAAERLCASLGRSHLSCQPTIFGGQHVALE